MSIQRLITTDGKPITARQARIDLGDIPSRRLLTFLSLRIAVVWRNLSSIKILTMKLSNIIKQANRSAETESPALPDSVRSSK